MFILSTSSWALLKIIFKNFSTSRILNPVKIAEDSNAEERTAVIQGSMESIQHANHLIAQYVAKASEGGQYWQQQQQ